MELFKIGGKIEKKGTLIILGVGTLVFLLVWYLLTFPTSKNSIQFSNFNAHGPVYEWKGPNNLSEKFDGDNSLIDIKPGSYELVYKDSSNNSLKEKIEVPKDFSETIYHTFYLTKDSTVSLNIEVGKKTEGLVVPRGTLPNPVNVFTSIFDLFKVNDKFDFTSKKTLPYNLSFSVLLNLLGYIEAIIASILLGFLIGLVPFFRSLLSQYVNAIRFIPLTAVTGLFIAWFGIESNMKVQFLSFGIFVYLLPVVVQRIDEISKVYIQTAYTLGANSWQTIKSVYWPYVSSKLIDDIRVLTAISWTYIIVAELLNKTGGLGAMIHISERRGRIDEVFALLIIIVLIGIIQDFLFVQIDKMLFPHKKIN